MEGTTRWERLMNAKGLTPSKAQIVKKYKTEITAALKVEEHFSGKEGLPTADEVWEKMQARGGKSCVSF